MYGKSLCSGKSVFFTFLLLTISSIQAASVTTGMVSTVASRHLMMTCDQWSKLSFLAGQAPSVRDIRELKRSSSCDVLGYVAELSPHGFIVISSRTEIPPVIAYSYLTDFSWSESSGNTLLDIVRTDLDLRYKALESRVFPDEEKSFAGAAWDGYLDCPSSMPVEQWPPVGYSTTTGWVNTSWNQFDPYNMLCPREYPDGKRCVVGCVALAASMVVNYNSLRKNYAVKFHFDMSDKYVAMAPGVTINIDDDAETRDFPTFEELNVCLDRLREDYIYNFEPGDTGIAALNFACGIWDKTKYRSDGSQGDFPFKLCQVFTEKLGYSKARVINVVDYAVLRENMKDSLPAVITIEGTVVGNHIVVCDGLRQTKDQPDMYHINFGWGPDTPIGISETWYALPALPLGYNSVGPCLVDLEPPDESLQPDNLVGLSADNGFTGDGIYNKTAEGQSVGLALGAPSPFTYYVKVQNDGDRSCAFKVTLVKKGTADIELKCLENDSELDITDAITDKGWFTQPIAPAAEVVIRIELSASNSTGSYILDLFSEAVDDDVFSDMIRITTELGIEERNPSPGLTLDVASIVNGGEVAFSYTLSSTEHASVEIYDASGRLVRNLAGIKAERGTEVAVWDSRDDGGILVPRGAYFIVLRDGVSTLVAKVAVVR